MLPFFTTGVAAGMSLPWQAPADTLPPKNGFFQKIGGYLDSLKSAHYRDSVLTHLSREDRPPQPEENGIVKSEKAFEPYSGKVIRHIYYRRLPVFGPRNINDTSFTTRMELIRLANRLHYNSREWVIRQSLFFHSNDTINAYQLAGNERYLRNQPYISDARLYIVNAAENSDSVDVLVLAKDEFEYGADLSRVTTQALAAKVYNNNLFGAGQKLQAGFLWDNAYHPPWEGELQYTKYNVAGSFTDLSAGYSGLNNNAPLDTGVYEVSYYLSVNRPLYTSTARLTGGLSLALNRSVNIYGRSDSVYRDYRYGVIDAWAGYNFRSQLQRDGSFGNKPSLAVLLRHYNRSFQKRPSQEKYQSDPVYSNRRFYLGEFVLFKQDFFKTSRFFGFGRTEDIPLGYNVAIAMGRGRWAGIKRTYSGIHLQKFWTTSRQSLLNISLGLGGFWHEGRSEDAVLQGSFHYYSRLLDVNSGWLRQFFTVDYINCPNPRFYKPLNINRENGINGFKNTTLNGYQRLNINAETVYYSLLRFYGFKFNFFSSLQASQLSDRYRGLFKNPVYAGIGAGCRIRNENLPVNTLKIAVNYYPVAPAGVKSFYFELTTVANFRFNIFALEKPGFLEFR